MKKIIIDLDGTLTKGTADDYVNQPVNSSVVNTLRDYKKLGFTVVISTARNMRTYEGNIGKINLHTLPDIISWLNRNDIPFDEILVGKPWCGDDGFYVDDKAIRPSEFSNLSQAEIDELLQFEVLFRER